MRPRPRLLLLVAAALAVAPAPWAGAAAIEHEPTPAGLAGAADVIPDSVRFDQEVQAGNSIAMTMTNYGFYGNNFYKRDASLEYPAGRGYEHLIRGGLWVGAVATGGSGEFVGVTTGAMDARVGPNSTQSTEWTPGGLDILKRSILPTSPYYDPLRAVSELDFVSVFNDASPRQIPDSEVHQPMGVEVRHETYQWDFAEFANILFVHITVKNRGPLLRNLWVGVLTELGSGCKKCYTNWPPSANDPGGMGTWFYKRWIAFDDSLSLLREHYCQQFAPPPADPVSGCNIGLVPYWIGLKVLGSRGLAEDTTTRRLSFALWNWTPGSELRDEDFERYALMSTGVIQPVEGDTLMPGTGDPVEVLAVGPFPLVYRDSSIVVDLAWVGGAGGAGGYDVTDLHRNARWAQFAYDNDYTLPVPPPSPRFAVVPRDTALDFYWDAESENAFDVTSPEPRDFQGYRVYVGEDQDTLARVAQFDVAGDTASFNTGFGAVALREPVTVGGITARYRFTVGGLRNGFKYFCAVTAFDLGNSTIRPLESGLSQNRLVAVPGPRPGERPDRTPTVFPNPYRVEARWDTGTNVRDHFLWFANLPEKCTLRIYTLAGDLLVEKEFDGATYQGEGSRGVNDPSSPLGAPTLSGSMYGWNLLTRNGQAVASGLYLYSVEDHAQGGKYHVGKFLVIKSDRESR